MALIVPRLKADTLELRAPGMLRLICRSACPTPRATRPCAGQIWDDTVRGLDCDDLAAGLVHQGARARTAGWCASTTT